MLFRALIACLGYLCFNLRDDYLILADANVYAARVIPSTCLLYTSDAADEEDSVDLGGRRIIKKIAPKKNIAR